VVAKNDVGDILELVRVVMCIDLNVVKDSAGDFHYGPSESGGVYKTLSSYIYESF
jgi:hypothetical protein